MNDKKANLVVTDPPYNVNYEGSAGKIKNDNMANEAFYEFLLSALTNTEAAMAQDASVYVFHADTEGLNFRKAFSDAGFYLSGTCIWKKQSLVLGRSPYQWQHEPVLFGWKKKGKHNWYADRKQTTIWEFEKPKKNSDHPTMKPVALVAHPILNSSLSNCIVLDPFGGSGSTLIACEQTQRICYTIELDEKFCDVIVKRYIEQAGKDDDVFLLRNDVEQRYRDLPEINKPTAFKAKDSSYSKEMADYAVGFIECLAHTKGTWAGKPFELIDWQEQIIRDLFGTLKPNGYRQFNTAYGMS